MTPRDFILKTIEFEGGFVNSPSDPGGMTKYGISQKYNPDVDVKNLTVDEAVRIYFERYWLKSFAPLWYNADYQAISFLIFDCRVSGQKASLVDFQKVLNTNGARLTTDGAPGRLTLAAMTDLDTRGVVDEESVLKDCLALAPLTAQRVAQATMRTQKAKGLKIYDYTNGFRNRMVHRLEFAKGLCYA